MNVKIFCLYPSLLLASLITNTSAQFIETNFLSGIGLSREVLIKLNGEPTSHESQSTSEVIVYQRQYRFMYSLKNKTVNTATLLIDDLTQDELRNTYSKIFTDLKNHGFNLAEKAESWTVYRRNEIDISVGRIMRENNSYTVMLMATSKRLNMK